MRLLLWLLLAGCSSTGNSPPVEPADASIPTCPGVPLSTDSRCAASYSPATDGPEQLCRDVHDRGFDVGSAGGYVYVGSHISDGWTGCYYDPDSGVLVGVVQVGGGSYCNGIVPNVDDVPMHHVNCPDPDLTSP